MTTGTSDEPPHGASLDELRAWAERLTQANGMASVIVGLNGSHHMFVATRETLAQYSDPVISALVDAIRQRQEILTSQAVRASSRS